MKNKLKDSLKIAMKARDQVRLDTIRSLMAAIQYEEMQKETEDLPGDSILAIIRSEIKKRKEETDFAQKASRPELVEKLAKELSILEEFLPSQLGQADLEKIITELKQSNPGLNLGVAMKMLKDNYAGQYDGKIASDVAKRILV
jgi:uncharacterized protein YqeY